MTKSNELEESFLLEKMANKKINRNWLKTGSRNHIKYFGILSRRQMAILLVMTFILVAIADVGIFFNK